MLARPCQRLPVPERRALKRAVLAATLALASCDDSGDTPRSDLADSAIGPATVSPDAMVSGGASGGQQGGGFTGGQPGLSGGGTGLFGGGTDAGTGPGGGVSGVDPGATGGAGGRVDGGMMAGNPGGSAADGGAPVPAGDGGGAAQPSSGCGMEPAAASGDATISVNGMDRRYVLALPQSYDKSRPYPLVLAFHGAGLTGTQFRSFFNLVTPVAADAIVVYPTGTGGQWDVRRDLPFVDALIMQLQSSYCVDTQRIFATGHSNGAFFTNAIGCQRGDVLRAIAPMSGGQQQQASSCKGEVAVWVSHGASDNIVMTSYGRQTRDFWVRRNECDAMMSTPVMPSPCVEYQGCAAGSPVRYCEYPGDHNLMANSAQTIWAFFKQL